MNRILIVEDDQALGRGLAVALSALSPVLAQTCAEARQALLAGGFDLALLDSNLPDGSGLDLLTEIRQLGDMPVILLTANDLETDIVTGLTLGADDYIVKPFSLAVLRARVDARLRRPTSAGETRIGPFVFDFDKLLFTAHGKPVPLSQTEQKLLRLLVENRGATLARATLIDRVWTDGADYVDENALSVSVGRLRAKLGTDAPIKTVYGIGYRWAVDG